VFFKQHTPIKIFKPRLVDILYHKGVNGSSTSAYESVEKLIRI
jgi:hypothetical protein